MTQAAELWVKNVKNALNKIAKDKGLDITITDDQVVMEIPPKLEMGDLAFPMFPYARHFRMGPPVIAAALIEALQTDKTIEDTVVTAGPYVNVKLKRENYIKDIIGAVSKADGYGDSASLTGQKVMVEFSCPNTNKPLHLGHLRNNTLGESISRILKANTADVKKVNLINDRGIHICKSMLAYQEFGNGTTPESEGVKSDHFVGQYYVKYSNWSKEDDQAEVRAKAMLKKWEEGDEDILKLWRQMNDWAIGGIEKTYDRTGVSFDKVYYESETYVAGKEEVLKGLEKGIFYKEKDGSIWVDLEDIKLDKKVLLRSDGTSLYLTQDIGTAMERQRDWPFKRLVYVVASEQQYHFKVLFEVLHRLGNDWAKNLYHLSYGMVNLPEGKMKSREGTVVDADDLITQLAEMAKQEIISKGREDEVEDLDGTSEKIALGALHYYLLQTSPVKDMIFDPKESLSFNGNTGPYLQYMGVRIISMLKKFNTRRDEFDGVDFKHELLQSDDEWGLLRMIENYPSVVAEAAAQMNPSIIANNLYEIAKSFSKYYHDNPILNNEDKELVVARIELVKGVLVILKHAFSLLNIPFLEVM